MTNLHNEAVIKYFGEQTRVVCDRNCGKAWGINSRPKVSLADDPDDYYYMADGELGVAPADPGTYEGNDGKPASPDEFPNKWCVRECERSAMTALDADWRDTVPVPFFDKRMYNQLRPLVICIGMFVMIVLVLLVAPVAAQDSYPAPQTPTATAVGYPAPATTTPTPIPTPSVPTNITLGDITAPTRNPGISWVFVLAVVLGLVVTLVGLLFFGRAGFTRFLQRIGAGKR